MNIPVIPSHNAETPTRVSGAFCRRCGNEMRHVLRRSARTGGIPVGAVTYFCDTCRYGWKANDEYVTGQATRWEPEPEPVEAPHEFVPETASSPELVQSPPESVPDSKHDARVRKQTKAGA